MGSQPRTGPPSRRASGGLFRHRSPSSKTTLAAWALVGAQFALIGGLVFWSPPADWSVPQPLNTAGSLLRTLGLVWMALAAVSLGRFISPLPLPLERGGLRTGGLYRLSRHPIYTGLIGFAVGTAVRGGSLGKALVAVALALLLTVKARFEEDHLRVAYPGYRDYQSRTPRFLPTGRLLRRRPR
ncbi:MAG TPA: isoprenylcysteine carboxylmethyltransferase family protein [Acidimicrobiia bacterium]|nr:isoprenylcysteine carboxylmethyltransferase family protein [Acidimicrobiia bacterium]